jgi:hypothetical protein
MKYSYIVWIKDSDTLDYIFTFQEAVEACKVQQKLGYATYIENLNTGQIKKFTKRIKEF